MTTSKLAEEIKKKEAIRFIDEETGEVIEPYLRVMDNDLKLINDLSRLHALQFVATKKDNRDAAINNARMWITEGRVEIHERCKTLIYHLENAQWNKARTDFKHMKDTPNGDILGGHADAIPAFVYMIRNIIDSRNPYPEGYGRLKGNNVFYGKHKHQESEVGAWVKDMLNIKRK
jgi:hypothetical protein